MIDDRLLALTGDAGLWRGPLSEACYRFDIDNADRQAMFIAQCAHESAGFTRLVEDLRYSAQRLLTIWPKRFTPALAEAMAYNERGIAERVYGGRLGNGLEGTGDGYEFRGRGLFQITGRANYRTCGRALGVDIESAPDLLEAPEFAALSAGWYWDSRGCNELADRDDYTAVTRKINGGVIGMDDRLAWLHKAQLALK